MRYLLGDSSESGLDFNYLAYLREVLDCSVVLIEHESALAVAKERRKARESDAHGQVQAIEDLGKRAAQLFGPIAKDHASSPLGRCAAAIGGSTRDAIATETSQVRAALQTELDVIEKDTQRLRTRTLASLEKLLKTHDLPDATRSYEVLWTANGVKAQLRQRAPFGVEAVLTLDVPAASLFTMDLRVDRIVDGVEINALEAGGWLKKGEKLVPHKLGRHHITRVTVGTDVTIRLRTTLDANASGFDVIVPRPHDGKLAEVLPSGILIDRVVGTTKELTIDKHQEPAFGQLADKLEAAARALDEQRTALVSVEIDGTAIGDHSHPLVFVERFILAIAPVVQRISRHSRSPGELVLRVMLGNDRREEIFVTIADLLKRIEGVTGKARDVFAPLHLENSGPPPPPSRTRPPTCRCPARPRRPRRCPALDAARACAVVRSRGAAGAPRGRRAQRVGHHPGLAGGFGADAPAGADLDDEPARPRSDSEPEIEVRAEPAVVVADEADRSKPTAADERDTPT